MKTQHTPNHFVIRMERGGYYNGISDRYVTVVEKIDDAHVFLTRQIADETLRYLHTHAMHCYGGNHVAVAIEDKSGLPIEIQKLISVFKVSKPYALEYSYRTKRGKQAHQRDLPVLKDMINRGMVELVEKTPSKILYQYKATGEKEEVK